MRRDVPPNRLTHGRGRSHVGMFDIHTTALLRTYPSIHLEIETHTNIGRGCVPYLLFQSPPREKGDEFLTCVSTCNSSKIDTEKFDEKSCPGVSSDGARRTVSCFETAPSHLAHRVANLLFIQQCTKLERLQRLQRPILHTLM